MIDKPISDLLDNTDIELLNIPIFQRPYSWNKEHLSQFISDLDNCINDEDQRHFYGLIVFVNNHQNKKIVDIIDGQQRLTTILIMMAIIRDLLEDYELNFKWDEDDKKEITKTVFKIDSLLSSELSNYKVKLNSENESNFENDFLEIIQRPITSYKDKTKTPRKEYEDLPQSSKNRFEVKNNYLYNYKNDKRRTRHKTSYKNYIALYNFIHKELIKKSNNVERYKYLIGIYKKTINDFRIIPFRVDSYDRAFEYFEVLNDRGLDVSALDLIKNRCLQIKGITAGQRNEIFESWSDIFSSTLDHTYNLIQFVRYAYMSEHGHITNKKIYEKYRLKLDTKNFDQTLEYLNGPLLVKSKVFKDFQAVTTNLESKIHNALQLLKSTKTVQWYSVAMSALVPLYEGKQIKTSTKNLIIQLFESLHELMFTLNYVEKVANDLEKKLPEIASKINYETLEQFEHKLQLATSALDKFKIEQSLTFENIDLTEPSDWVRNFEKNNDLGHMFVFLFLYKKQGSSTVQIHTSSLEHTLPQKPSVNNWPAIDGIVDHELKRHIYSLGNFFITHSRDNSTYGNKSFSKKAKLYTQDKIFDIFDDTNSLNYKKVKEWSFDIIINREKALIKLFNEIQN